MTLPSQRALFAIPRDVYYLNAASGQPWKIDPGFAAEQHERARRHAAALIGAEPADVALISSVSYGVATAAKILSPPAGFRTLVLQNDHSPPVLEWATRAQPDGLVVDTVPRPADGDWTAAVLGLPRCPEGFLGQCGQGGGEFSELGF